MTQNGGEYPIVPPPALVPRRRFQIGLVLVVMVACGLSVVVDLFSDSGVRLWSVVIRAIFFLLLGAFILGLGHSSGHWRLKPRQ